MNPEVAAVEFVDVSKTYYGRGEPVFALRSVSLTVAPGEHLAVMGPSGSGKSTLLAIAGCLDEPDHGRYRLFGREVSGLLRPALAKVRRDEIGFVFQNLSLLDHLDAQANVALPFDYSGIGEERAQTSSLAALERVGMLEMAKRRPRELSGGQQQRVSIARAIVSEPRLLLADEPTGALDKRSAHEVMDQLCEMARVGLSIITVTHDPEVAARADRVLHFRDGNFER